MTSDARPRPVTVAGVTIGGGYVEIKNNGAMADRRGTHAAAP